MNTEYFLAVDIGASSGRHILGWLTDGKMYTEEVYRFENGMKNVRGALCWDLEHLKNSIITGMKKCKEIGKIPMYMGIDTWAVDYVLLDQKGEILGKTYGYRDHRTDGMDNEVYKYISAQELYEKTGIQKQPFNTIYQLMAHKTYEPDILANAEDMLMIPDYLGYLLTGEKVCEYTNATTTQLVNPTTKNWDYELIDRLGYPRKIFKEIRKPGSRLAGLKEDIINEVGYNLTVMLPATHDTGSAVLAVPFEDEGVYISSGTWSLMGTELMEADCSTQAMMHNFTNEGGFDYRFRYLKNIMGLWMIQSVRNELGREYSFSQLCEMAESETDYEAYIDVNDKAFLSPDSMMNAISEYCRENGQKIPKTPGQFAKVIYKNLARSYGETIKELENNTNKGYDTIYVVGGGCNAEYLNELTARTTGKKVMAGPSEATAIGNILAQMLGAGKVESIAQARTLVRKSTNIKIWG